MVFEITQGRKAPKPATSRSSETHPSAWAGLIGIFREDRVGLRGQELPPGGIGSSGRRIQPAFLRIVQMVEAATAWPRPTNSPWMRL